MSPKIMFIAAAAFAASAAAIPASAAPGDAGQNQTRPVPLRASIMFNLIDRNADGSIDQEEIAALQKAIFSAIDTDKDGKLTQEEFRKVAAGFEGGQRGPGRFIGRGPGMGGPGFHGPRDHRGPGDDRGPGNRQGQLEDQQAPGGPGGPQLGDNQDGQPQPRDFASLDSNGDGVVSSDEFAAGGPNLPGVPPVTQQ